MSMTILASDDFGPAEKSSAHWGTPVAVQKQPVTDTQQPFRLHLAHAIATQKSGFSARGTALSFVT